MDTDAEVISEGVETLRAAYPDGLQISLGNQNTTGEVVGCGFCLLGGRAVAIAGVQATALTVVDDVLELVVEGETLTGEPVVNGQGYTQV